MKKTLIGVMVVALFICTFGPGADARKAEIREVENKVTSSGTPAVGIHPTGPIQGYTALSIEPILQGNYDTLNKAITPSSEYDQYFCARGGSGDYRWSGSGFPDNIGQGIIACMGSVCNIYGVECQESAILWIVGRPQYSDPYNPGKYNVKITLEDRVLNIPDAELEYTIDIWQRFQPYKVMTPFKKVPTFKKN